MASSNGKKSDNHRPHPLHTSRSFSRIEPASPKQSTRTQRASTIQNGVIPEDAMSDKSSASKGAGNSGRQQDVFGHGTEDEEEEDGTDDEGSGKLPADFDELPIELVSLTDRQDIHPR